jgi:hypothetical protein
MAVVLLEGRSSRRSSDCDSSPHALLMATEWEPFSLLCRLDQWPRAVDVMTSTRPTLCPPYLYPA